MQAVTFIFAFVAVLALIVVAAWLVRRFAGNRLGANTNRGRMPRLAVIDAAPVDGRRRLVLVRRDNIEHLLMIGGPTDIVVESNIVRANAANRDQLPQRPSAVEPPPRIAPVQDTPVWAENEIAREEHVPMPEPVPRPARPAFVDELRRPPPVMPERPIMPERPVMPERRSDPLAGLAPEPLNLRPEPPRPEPRLEPRAEPRPEPVVPRMPRMDTEAPPRMPRMEPEAAPPRMPRMDEAIPPRMPRGEPLMPRPIRPSEPPKAPPMPMRAPERAAPPPPPPPPQAPPPNANADQNLAEMAQRLEAALRRPAAEPMAPPPVPPEPVPNGRPMPRGEAPIVPAPPAPPSPKTSFENLEDEMASLLGRPKSSSSS